MPKEEVQHKKEKKTEKSEKIRSWPCWHYIQNSEKQLESYSFLSRLNNFLNLRNDTRSNLKNGDDEDEKDEMPAISDDDTGRMSDADAYASNASEWSVKRKMGPSMTSSKESSSRNQSGSNIDPQSLFTKYLRLTLIFMWHSTLPEKFNFCFYITFC